MKIEDNPVFQPNYMQNAISKVIKALANEMMNMFMFYAKNSNNTDWMNGYLAAINDLNEITQSVQKGNNNAN